LCLASSKKYDFYVENDETKATLLLILLTFVPWKMFEEKQKNSAFAETGKQNTVQYLLY
jgi:hypothetical protein